MIKKKSPGEMVQTNHALTHAFELLAYRLASADVLLHYPSLTESKISLVAELQACVKSVAQRLCFLLDGDQNGCLMHALISSS